MTYAGEVLADAPSAWWRLGEASGTVAADASGNGRNATYVNAPLLGEAGALGTDLDRAVKFDGSNDRLDLPALPVLGTTFSIELWLKPDGGADTDQNLIGEADGNPALRWRSTTRLLDFYNGSSHFGGNALRDGVWYHVVLSVLAGSAALYVNGVVDATFAGVAGGFAPDRVADDNSSETFKGWLDEVAVYAGMALSQSRVQAHFWAAFNGFLSLRPRLRRELRDEDATAYRWTDLELERHLARAVDELSEAWPDERLTALVATPGSRDLSLGALDQVVRIEAVEWPVGRYPREYVRFETWGPTLSLLVDGAPSAADSVNVYWGRRHAVEERTSTLPQETEEVVLLGAGGFALVELSEYVANRANVGGPAASLAYRREGEERLREFRRGLRRFGRAGRVRRSALYAPARPLASKTTDFGPG